MKRPKKLQGLAFLHSRDNKAVQRVTLTDPDTSWIEYTHYNLPLYAVVKVTRKEIQRLLEKGEIRIIASNYDLAWSGGDSSSRADNG